MRPTLLSITFGQMQSLRYTGAVKNSPSILQVATTLILVFFGLCIAVLLLGVVDAFFGTQKDVPYTITYLGSEGRTLGGYGRQPENPQEMTPVVLVFHDIQGLSVHEQAIVDQLTNEGFHAYAPDYLDQRSSSTILGRKVLEFSYSRQRILEDIDQAYAYIREIHGPNRPVVLMGRFFGAALALSWGLAQTDIAGVYALDPWVVPGSADLSATDFNGELWVGYSNEADPRLWSGTYDVLQEALRDPNQLRFVHYPQVPSNPVEQPGRLARSLAPFIERFHGLTPSPGE